jgi:hypothetical protein
MKGGESVSSRGLLIMILLIMAIIGMVLFVFGGYNLIRSILFPG